ncbi:MAG: hypothetical protein WCC53_08310 [Thermoanaerobaculia bacterium]
MDKGVKAAFKKLVYASFYSSIGLYGLTGTLKKIPATRIAWWAPWDDLSFTDFLFLAVSLWLSLFVLFVGIVVFVGTLIEGSRVEGDRGTDV